MSQAVNYRLYIHFTAEFCEQGGGYVSDLIVSERWKTTLCTGECMPCYHAHSHFERRRDGVQPYRRVRASWKADLCSVKSCCMRDRTVSQVEAPFTFAKSTAFWSLSGSCRQIFCCPCWHWLCLVTDCLWCNNTLCPEQECDPWGLKRQPKAVTLLYHWCWMTLKLTHLQHIRENQLLHKDVACHQSFSLFVPLSWSIFTLLVASQVKY